MSYEKQTWQTGDVVTSAKLNHMEDGIAAGGGDVFVVHYDGGTVTADKTFSEIYAAVNGGKTVILCDIDGYWYWPADINESEIEFQGLFVYENELNLNRYKVTESGWTGGFDSYVLTPAQ